MKLALLLLIPLAVQAQETRLACELELAKAEVQASILHAPSAFGSIGQDATTGSKSMSIGVSQSFSGRARADLVRKAAQAKCDSIRATLQLDEHARWAVLKVQRDGAVAELALVTEAIRFAKENLALLAAQLEAQTITLSQHTEGSQLLVSLENREAELLRQLSVPVLPPPQVNVTALIESSRAAEAETARLAAQSQAEAGWDVVVAGGVRQPLGGSASGGASPFATIALSYSFGYSAAKEAAARVGKKTSALLAVQQDGYNQTTARQAETLKRLIAAELQNSTTNYNQIVHLSQLKASLNGLDTALALNTLRALKLQLFALRADLAGAEARAAGYKFILAQLQ